MLGLMKSCAGFMESAVLLLDFIYVGVMIYLEYYGMRGFILELEESG